MPVPRRQLHLLVQDAAGTTPVTRSVERERYASPQRRCRRCRCVLAHDQRDTWCSPCQRAWNRMPDHLSPN